jgi:glyoxylase-like metal-dependent hydrolase (beta-lactamase superfamily II)
MDNREFVQLTDRTWVFPGSTRIGVLDMEDGVYLIDSGNDKEAGRLIMKKLKERGLQLKAVINTHSNADHIGADSYLRNTTGCDIWASPIEAAFIENPVLEPSFLWGGYPFKALRSKFFEARPAEVTRIISADSVPAGLKFIPLPGHFFEQVGVLTDDGVSFLGDSLFGPEILDKYPIPFIYDVDAFKKSIETIRGIKAEHYVLSHGGEIGNIDAVALKNLERAEEIEAFLFGILREAKVFDDILKDVCDHFGVALDHGQYVLTGSTVKSFLSFMADSNKISYRCKDNRMFWRQT